MNDKHEDETKDIAVTKEKRDKPKGFLLLLVFLLSISAISFSYYNYQSLQRLNSVRTGVEANQVLISDLQSSIQSITTNNSGFDSQLNEVNNRLEMFEQSLTGIYDDIKSDNEDWALAEIEHLVIIASHQLVLDGDVMTALSALTVADDSLKAINNPELFEIRRQLISDINKLRAINYPDIPGMALNVSELINRVPQLPLKQGATELLFESDTDEDNAVEGAAWKRFLNTIWLELKGLVSISKQNENTIISLLPDQQYYLFQNLRLELEAARLSILQKDKENLNSSIENVSEWINIYFDSSDAGVKHLVDTLAEIKNVELNPVLPDISSSLESIRTYVRNKSNSTRDTQITNGVND